MDRRRRIEILAVLVCTGTVAGVDQSILNVALPTLVRQLHASTSQLQWIVDSYTVVYGSFMITSGSLGDRWGRARTWKFGAFVFMAASAAAAFSGSPTVLTALRAVMGLGATMTVPMSLSIIAHTFTRPSERARAIGLWTAGSFLGVATGPIIGGALLSRFWWGSVFLVTVPVILVMLIVGTRVLPESKDPEAARFDPLGVVLSAGTFGVLLWGIIEAPEQGWLSARTLGAFALAVLAGAAFVMWEWHKTAPMIEMSLFVSRRFTVGTVASSLVIFSYTGSLFLITQLFQFVLGYSPLVTGLWLMPAAAVMAGGGVLSPIAVARFGAKPVMVGGALVGGGGALLLGLSGHWGLTWVVAAISLIGEAMALTFAPSLELALGAISRHKSGIASATNNTIRQFWTAMGIAVLGSICASGYRTSITSGLLSRGISRSHITAATQSVGSALALAARTGTRNRHVIVVTARDAFLHGMLLAMATAAGVCGVAALLSAFLLPRITNPRRSEPSLPDHQAVPTGEALRLGTLGTASEVPS